MITPAEMVSTTAPFNEKQDPPARPSVSIIVCTRNRAESLRKTLESIREVDTAPFAAVELIVVDNGSTDDTHQAVADMRSERLPLRYLEERQPGKSRALNLGIAHATGDLLVFTDDDVRVDANWLCNLAKPIVLREADAVQGAIKLSECLCRPWMGGRVLASLAHHVPESGRRVWLIGANFAISRDVLKDVPGFDPSIGPPISGGEDTLFSEQVEAAGFRIVAAPHAVVEHHPDGSRLRRGEILEAARKGGRSDAYLAHHWHHQAFANVPNRLFKAIVKLCWHRLTRPGDWLGGGVPDWEHADVHSISRWRHYYREVKRPRRYSRRHAPRMESIPAY